MNEIKWLFTIGVLLAAVLLVGSPAGATRQSHEEAHVYGSGNVTVDGCSGWLNIHATQMDHPGQFVDLRAVCGTDVVDVAGVEPDCIFQTGSTAFLSYEDEELRIRVEDGGPNADNIAIAIGPFKQASPKRGCGARALEALPAVGEFLVGLP